MYTMYMYQAEMFRLNHEHYEWIFAQDGVPMFAARDYDAAKAHVAAEFPGYFESDEALDWEPIYPIGGTTNHKCSKIYIGDIHFRLYEYPLNKIQYHGVLKLVKDLFDELGKPVFEYADKDKTKGMIWR